MGGPGQGLLWAETQRFWSESSTEFLHKIRQQGRKVNPNFLVVPNLGPMAHLHGVWSRKSMGMDADIWSKACDLIMYEEMHQPGEMAPNIYYDHILQYKYAFACNFKGGMLSYNAQDSNSIALSMAEAGAGGGGCLMQAGYNSPSVRKSVLIQLESVSRLSNPETFCDNGYHNVECHCYLQKHRHSQHQQYSLHKLRQI